MKTVNSKLRDKYAIELINYIHDKCDNNGLNLEWESTQWPGVAAFIYTNPDNKMGDYPFNGIYYNFHLKCHDDNKEIVESDREVLEAFLRDIVLEFINKSKYPIKNRKVEFIDIPKERFDFGKHRVWITEDPSGATIDWSFRLVDDYED